jgi:hypothetical protein
MWKSTDGGTSFSEINTPHGDNHDLWIDPVNPNRMVEGNDGGACVSFNGGATWSSIYNQSTAQFYRIDMDDRYPYRVYGTQQDNTTIAVPSATAWGAITLGDCTYPGTGESGFIAVHPQIPISSIAGPSAPAPAALGRCSVTTTALGRSSSSMSGPRSRPASRRTTSDTGSPGPSQSFSRRMTTV